MFILMVIDLSGAKLMSVCNNIDSSIFIDTFLERIVNLSYDSLHQVWLVDAALTDSIADNSSDYQ